MDAVFCVDCLEEAIRAYGTPEIFNSDQGSPFTSDAFTGVLIDNEDVYYWLNCDSLCGVIE